MVEFFITRTKNGFALIADGEMVDNFDRVEDAADMAVRFAQDIDAAGYRIFYP